MGYPISAKAIEMAHNLADNLKQRTSAGALAAGGPVSEAFDSNGLPTIQVGSSTAGGEGAFIQVAPQSWPLGTDVLGNAGAVYTPTIIRIAIEAISSGGVLPVTLGLLQALLSEAAQTGARVELWQSASGTAPSDSTFNTPANLTSSFESFQYPLVGNV